MNDPSKLPVAKPPSAKPPLGLVPVLQLLQIPEKCLTILVKDHLPGLETLMPVQGEIQLHHKGTFLEVSAQATAIVTLGCDRCLNQYNHRIALDTTEIIWLEEAEDLGPGDALEREIEFEDLVERISPRGSFDPAQWLYEQLCLAIPPQQLCDLDCDGILVETEVAQPSEPAIDHRWAALAQLKQQLPS